MELVSLLLDSQLPTDSSEFWLDLPNKNLMGLRFFLLNTRILLEALLDSDQLPVVIQIALMNPTNTIGFSVASIWEIVIKSALDREDLSSTQ